MRLLVLTAIPLAFVGAACSATTSSQPLEAAARCDANRTADSLHFVRHASLPDRSIGDLADGLSFSDGITIESRGCALHALRYNILNSELAVHPDVKVQLYGGVRRSATVARGPVSPVIPSWDGSDLTPAAAPAIPHYQFVTATTVPGPPGAFVGIWRRHGAGEAPQSMAVAFRRTAPGVFGDPRILLRSEDQLTDVFVGPSIHGDERLLSVIQDLPADNAIRLLTFGWLSARYYQ